MNYSLYACIEREPLLKTKAKKKQQRNIRVMVCQMDLIREFTIYWHMQLFHFSLLSDQGSMTASTDSIDLEISILVGADATGRPNITCTDCSFDVGHLNVHFDGGAR